MILKAVRRDRAIEFAIYEGQMQTYQRLSWSHWKQFQLFPELQSVLLVSSLLNQTIEALSLECRSGKHLIVCPLF